jgi:hypothetical protein
VTPEVAVVGISRLDDHVLLADAALVMPALELWRSLERLETQLASQQR